MGIFQNTNGTYLPCQFSGYGIYQGYPKKLLVHNFYQFFWDMGYPRDIPKKIRYMLFFSFLGIWDIPGISQKNTVHSFKQKSGDMGYPRSIPKIVPYIGFPLFLIFRDLGQWTTYIEISSFILLLVHFYSITRLKNNNCHFFEEQRCTLDNFIINSAPYPTAPTSYEGSQTCKPLNQPIS